MTYYTLPIYTYQTPLLPCDDGDLPLYSFLSPSEQGKLSQTDRANFLAVEKFRKFSGGYSLCASAIRHKIVQSDEILREIEADITSRLSINFKGAFEASFKALPKAVQRKAWGCLTQVLQPWDAMRVADEYNLNDRAVAEYLFNILKTCPTSGLRYKSARTLAKLKEANHPLVFATLIHILQDHSPLHRKREARFLLLKLIEEGTLFQENVDKAVDAILQDQKNIQELEEHEKVKNLSFKLRISQVLTSLELIDISWIKQSQKELEDTPYTDLKPFLEDKRDVKVLEDFGRLCDCNTLEKLVEKLKLCLEDDWGEVPDQRFAIRRGYTLQLACHYLDLILTKSPTKQNAHKIKGHLHFFLPYFGYKIDSPFEYEYFPGAAYLAKKVSGLQARVNISSFKKGHSQMIKTTLEQNIEDKLKQSLNHPKPLPPNLILTV